MEDGIGERSFIMYVQSEKKQTRDDHDRDVCTAESAVMRFLLCV